MKKAPISVVVPAYNGEWFVGAAIQSVQAQTLGVSEIIVVDDGSTDRTAEIAKELGAAIIQQPNRGVSAARNAGIRAARNEWVAFIDQDDLWKPQKIERQWAAIKTHPEVGIVSCNLRWFENAAVGDLADKFEHEDRVWAVNDGAIKYFARANEVPLSRMADYTSSLLVRRDLLLSIGMFDERLRQNEDLECFLRAVTRSALAIVQESLVLRRLHDRNVSLENPREAFSTYQTILDWLRTHADRYPPGPARAYSQTDARRLIFEGRTLLQRGKRSEARALFSRSIWRAYSSRGVALWCLTFLNPAVIHRLLALKRKVS
jgi:glycosyltransferase involved in cell wall biosynthesis